MGQLICNEDAMQKKVIWLVEDEASIADTLIYALQTDGFEVEWFPLGQPLLTRLEQTRPDFLILDVGLPDISGFELCKQVRARCDTPLMFLTARSEEIDRLIGLEIGADDYVAKPFRPRELVSRIRSVLRRCGRDKAVVTLGDVQADIERGQVTKNGADVYLTALEYRLLLVFVNNRGKVLSRSRLLEEIWDVAGDFVNDNTLTVYIKRLREKIETDPAAPQIIRTVRGLGYRVEL